jgi:uncharacterized membrane protein YgcG
MASLKRVGNKNRFVNNVIIISYILLMSIPYFIVAFSKNSNVDPGYTINSFTTTAYVKENNIVSFNEIIDVNWQDNYHHGIYRTIPNWGKYTGIDNKVKSKKAILSDFYATETYEVIRKKDVNYLKIGNVYETVKKGLHEYQINYNYNLGNDPYNDRDELIIHFFGDNWNTSINNPKVIVYLPKVTEINNITFWADLERKNNITDKVNYIVDENKIEVTVNDDYTLNKSLTMDLVLPEGYFKQTINTYGNFTRNLCLINILLLFVSLVLWYKKGRNNKEPETIEIYPPDKLNPALIGYIYGESNSKELTISLLLSLAAKNYIKIENNEGIITLKNNFSRPVITKTVEGCPTPLKRKIVIKKLKNGDENLTSDENSWLINYFSGINETTITNNFELFYNVKDSLINNGYIKIISDNEEDIKKLNEVYSPGFLKNEMEIEQKDLKKETLSEEEELLYNNLFKYNDIDILNTDYNFIDNFDKIADSIETKWNDKLNDNNNYMAMGWSLIILIISSVLFIISFWFIRDLNPKYSFLYIISGISCICNLICFLSMNRLTNDGERLFGRVKGFRDYLEKCEIEEMERNLSNDENYYNKILPYAYVLKLSRTWYNKFSSIIPENNNININDFNNIQDSFNNLTFNINDSIDFKTSSGGTFGGFSGGGGFGSSGGGSFGGGGS